MRYQSTPAVRGTKQSNVTFSIITVCLNAEKSIRSTIESVINQKWKDFEYIIVDGVSADATLSIVQEFAGVDKRIQWYSESDDGIFNAMNKGIRYAKGDFLLFLNAGDELYDNDVLEKAAQIVKDVDIVIGDVAFKTESGLSKTIYPIGIELLENLKRGKCVCHQVIFASKHCLIDGFDEKFMICADYDWLCRQVNAGKKIVKLDTVAVKYDIHGVTSQVRYQKRHWEEYFEIIGKNFPEPEFEYGDEVKALFIRQKKDHFLYEFMNRWLFLKQRGINLGIFFTRQRIYSIAIYGIHYMGQRLYEELFGSNVKVMYMIDQHIEKAGEWPIPIVHPEDALEAVDAVVITPIFDFLEIKEYLSARLDCLMFFIEDVLFYEYENIKSSQNY